MKLKNKFNILFILLIILCILTSYILLNNIETFENTSSTAKIAFITAIYGSYESSCKKYVKQSIPADFICFTDNKDIVNNGWIIDTTPYHYNNKSKLDNDTYTNSISNNKHTFNIAKYYKQSFQEIPRLKDYDVIVWLDGTIEITNDNVSNWVLNNINKYKIIGWHHEGRNGNLKSEVNASNIEKYTSTFWNNQNQPYQDIFKQYENYVKSGYDENFFKQINNNKEHFGVWLTCFIAFLNKDTDVTNFLNEWYLQTLIYTTQDQISFPYVSQKMNLIPYTLPDDEIKGDTPHENTDFYIKHSHGK
jgi:hypothetical protein